MSIVTAAAGEPTIVLVHGAFAESAGWNGVIARLHRSGLPAIAVANPLRSVSGDAAFLSAILDTVEGPIILVGHSYGGAVISTAASGADRVKALVFVAGFAPDKGESIGQLSGKYPGSTLGETLATVPLPDGTTDLYIRQEKYRQQFAADLPAEQAAQNAVGQRPLNDTALNEGAGEPAWRTIPSWFVIPGLDKNIPPQAQRFMAERAGSRQTVEIPDASHSVPISHPEAVAEVILSAAEQVR